ncbi:hypothetical protein CHS0354_029355 [Potamilus streckersoni]|uniref:Uncharacterized protein n=1 Tax=Potamilus streckersoni TaxID=2493646 RepID=A0AAE0T6S4_9BIVA|nr:hypothetical protein CHS0354_029355 [Potamilus streckersoni]
MAQSCEGDSSKMDTNFLSLQDVLHGFNSSINEEQAWAVCYQCSVYFLSVESHDKYKEIYYYGNVAIQVRKDGEVFIDSAPNTGSGKGPPRKRSSFSSSRDFKEVVTQVDAVEALGSAIYQALDYGLSETEEPILSHDLEELIELMVHNSDDDEGIGIESSRFNDEGQVDSDKSLFEEVIEHCVKHCSNEQDALHHYKAVCRALVAEALELLTFLDKMSRGREKLAKAQQNEDISLDELQRSDWARLWVQIMRELRNGVRLKKVEHVPLSPIEFELTPFEILLEDIRLGRFKLNRIMVNGDIPPKIKSDAHAVIVDFIRSRPPLRSVDKRKMNTPPKRELDPIEKLMAEIRQGYDLRPVQDGRRVVIAGDGDKSTSTARKVIKPDFNLLLSNSFSISDEDSDGSEDGEYASHCVMPNHMSPMSPVSPEKDAMMNKSWKCTVAKDILMQDGKRSKVVKRRHSINICNEILNSTKVLPATFQHDVSVHDENEELIQSDGFQHGHAFRQAQQHSSHQVHEAHNHSVSHVHVLDHPFSPSCKAVPPGQHVGRVASFRRISATSQRIPEGSVSHGHQSCPVHNSQSPLQSRSSCKHAQQWPQTPCGHSSLSKSPCNHLSRSESMSHIPVPVKCRHITRSETLSPHLHSPCRHLLHSDLFPSSVSGSVQDCLDHSSHASKSHRPSRAHSPCQHALHRDRSESPSRTRSRSHSPCLRHPNPNRADVSKENSFIESDESVVVDSECNGRWNKGSSKHSICASHEIRAKHGDSSLEPVVKSNTCEQMKQSNQTKSEENKSEGFVEMRSRTKSNTDKTLSKLTDQRVSEVLSENKSRACNGRSNVDVGLQQNDQILPGEVNERRSKTRNISRDEARIIGEGNNHRHDNSREEARLIEERNSHRHDNSRGEARPLEERNSHRHDNSRGETRPLEKRKSHRHNNSSCEVRPIEERKSHRHNNSSGEVRPLEERKSHRQDNSGTENTSQEEKRTADQDKLSLSKSIKSKAGMTDWKKLRSQPTSAISEMEQNHTDTAIKSDISILRERLSNIKIPHSSDKGNVEINTGIKSSDNTEIKSSNNAEEKRLRPIIRTSQSHVSDDLDLNKQTVHSSNEDSSGVKLSRSHTVTIADGLSSSYHVRRLQFGAAQGFLNAGQEMESHGEGDGSSLSNSSPTTLDSIKTNLLELDVKELLHVSWKNPCSRVDTNEPSTPCSDCRLVSRKWKNPIECLSLTLKEVTHIRMVLTKAELESLITDPELYNLVSKGKVCFTCKRTRFGLFSPWGTKCKFCQRTVCNFCLRKMNVPTEHFEKIPVYTLSPIPLSQETLDMLKVYESTGSVPQSPASQRKLSQQSQQQQQEQHQDQAESELEDNKASKRRSLQRSYTMTTGTRPPPNKALLKGPQMSICCDCKTMIMEIIRASRTSISVVNSGNQYSEEEKPEEKKPEIKLRPRSSLSRSETVTSEPRPRPKSLLNMPFNWSPK